MWFSKNKRDDLQDHLSRIRGPRLVLAGYAAMMGSGMLIADMTNKNSTFIRREKTS